MPATGVLSSWLALATKSRRTRSSRASSVTSETTASALSAVQRHDEQAVGGAARIRVELDRARLRVREAGRDRRRDGLRQSGLRRWRSRASLPGGMRNKRPAAPFAYWIVSPSEQEDGVREPVEGRAQGALLGLERV